MPKSSHHICSKLMLLRITNDAINHDIAVQLPYLMAKIITLRQGDAAGPDERQRRGIEAMAVVLRGH